MKHMPETSQREPKHFDASSLILGALEQVGGSALVLDSALHVVAATRSANELLGSPVPCGVAAAKLLCGQGSERPIAEALAAGRAAVGQVVRPHGTGAQAVQVQALPLDEAGVRSGWLLLLQRVGWEPAGNVASGVSVQGIRTRSPVMKKLLRDVERVAQREVTVLVRGETGSGKELVARALHASSRRAAGPFRAINCAALPPHLLESELFGHVRGAFTGAVRDHPGHFALADGGTLFLDEVGELPLDLQAKLLRVLQTRTFLPVGGIEPVHTDVRIVSATHRSLRQAVEEKTFRADLMYRIRVVPLFLPPLRDRPEDLELLAWELIERLNEEGERKVTSISNDALRAMQRYSWPGNVRELQNALEYAFALGSGPALTALDLPPEVRGESPSASRPAINEPAVSLAPNNPEAARVARALERAGGHRGRAAAILGISRSTLWRKMKELGVTG